MLLTNAICVNYTPSRIESVSVRIDGGAITESRKSLRPRRGEEVFDCGGRILLAGLVCAHTHLYSSLSRGMPPLSRSPRSFLEILTSLWWKLDRALDEETIYYSALVGGMEAVRCGTTTLVDHHASPNAIPGSLDIIKQALKEVGLRGILCYEVTDRGGKRKRDEGLQENERFLLGNEHNAQFRGIVGAHASFTLHDDSLRLCGELAKAARTGVHLHVAEDRCDVVDARTRHRENLIDRLRRHEILGRRSILAHCIHLRPVDFRKLRSGKSWLVHNPRSNMNNGVGAARTELFGKRAALGTDGFPADMWEEARIAFFKQREADSFARVSGQAAKIPGAFSLLHGGQSMVSELFGRSFGRVEAGSAADLIVLDYVPATPMHERNLPGHLLFGMNSSMVHSVMVEGRWVVRNRSLIGVNEDRVREKAAVMAKRLWDRIVRM